MGFETSARAIEVDPRLRADRVLSGFIDQLFLQRRRSALVGPRGGAIISDPITVDKILRAPEQFPKTFQFLEALGKSRFSTNGAEWTWRRDLTQSFYLRAASSQNRQKVAEVYRRRLAACESNEPAAITRALLAASTEIFHDALGCTVAVHSILNFFDRARDLLKQLQYYSLARPSPSERARLEGESDTLLKDYMAEIGNSSTFQSLASKFQDQAKADNFVAAEELMMNFFAAVESTTATLSTAIDRLGVYRDVQDRLAAEVTANQAFPQLECFINEILRYYPSIPFIVRQVASDAEIEGLQLKAGSIIIISIIGVHHHPEYWKNPDRFDCARPEFVEDRYDRRAFIPFSSGIRTCGGAKLARLELSEGLKAFIQNFIVKRQGEEISFDYTMAMRPKSWDRVDIARRV
jgi:cytochrome P450